MAKGERVRPLTIPPVKFTYDDLLHVPDDGMRREIIDGERYVTPSPNVKHQAISVNLTTILRTFLKQTSLGRVFAAPLDVVFDDINVVEPDLMYISRGRLEVLTEPNVRGTPDLVVEILSPVSRKTDLVKKRELYERFGVREYWIIDPDVETVTVFRHAGGALTGVAELHATTGEVLETLLLPGLSIALPDIFAP